MKGHGKFSRQEKYESLVAMSGDQNERCGDQALLACSPLLHPTLSDARPGDLVRAKRPGDLLRFSKRRSTEQEGGNARSAITCRASEAQEEKEQEEEIGVRHTYMCICGTILLDTLPSLLHCSLVCVRFSLLLSILENLWVVS